jgi:hypothetical protein
MVRRELQDRMAAAYRVESLRGSKGRLRLERVFREATPSVRENETSAFSQRSPTMTAA